jgi:hypothetical protein
MWWGSTEQERRSRRKSEREGKGGGKGMWVVEREGDDGCGDR